MSELEKPNVAADMMRIHRAITRGLTVSLERSQAFAQSGYPDEATQKGFTLYLQGLISVLNAHHRGEDEVAFPFLRERLPDAPFDQLMADHQTIHAILDELRPLALTAEAPAKLNGALARLDGLWRPHIGVEEDVFDLETAATVMTEEENAALGQKLGEHSQSLVTPPFIGIPFVLFNMEAGDRATMAKMMPPVVTQHLVPVEWKEMWAPMKPFLLD